jgi:hypothetical protein
MPEIEAYKLVMTNDKEYATIHEQLTHHGFIRSEPLIADTIHIGYVYVKFDNWSIAYDFVIVSIVTE